MRLKRIEINGFKSFADKSVIEFPAGISCIVGPNGCGKSNIVDAIKWVMGEQSVQQLRGKAMEDVIFSGTEKRARVNLAEVSLILSELDMDNDVEKYSEIMVTRRLYRSGESEYLINKRPCRLKDIQDIFLRHGIGSRSFAIIGQGMIGNVTEATVEKRRSFIEEAAGIIRYNTRKKEALSKLASTDRNIFRLNDLIHETKKLKNSLARQAKKAKQYKILAQDLKETDLSVMVYYYEDYSRKIEDASELLDSLKKAEDGHAAQQDELKLKMSGIESELGVKKKIFFECQREKDSIVRKIDRIEGLIKELEKEKMRLASERVRLRETFSGLYEKNKKIEIEIKNTEEEIKSLTTDVSSMEEMLGVYQKELKDVHIRIKRLRKEKKEIFGQISSLTAERARRNNLFQRLSVNITHASRRIEQLQAEIEEARASKTALEADADRSRQDQKDLEIEKKDLASKIAAVDADIGRLKTACEKERGRISSLLSERGQRLSELNVLKKMDENLEWYKEGVKAVIKRLQAENRKDGDMAPAVIGDIIEVEPGFENAVEAALGDAIQHVVVQDDQTALELIGYLHDRKAGRAGFISAENSGVMAQKPPEAESVHTRLLDHVKIKPGFETAVRMLLSGTLVADDLQSAIRISRETENHVSVVTKDGEAVDNRGVIIGGSRDKLSKILEKKGRIKYLFSEVRSLENMIEKAEGLKKTLEDRLEEQEAGRSRLQKQMAEIKSRIVESEKEFFKADERLKQLRQRLEVSVLELNRISGEKQDMEKEFAAGKSELDRLDAEIATLEQQAGKLGKTIGRLSDGIRDQDERIVSLRLEITRKKAVLENFCKNKKRLSEFLKDAAFQREKTSKDISENQNKLEKTEQEISRQKPVLEKEKSGLLEIKKRLSTLEAELCGLEKDMIKINENIRKAEDATKKVREEIHRLEIEVSGLKINRQHIISRFLEKYSESFDDILNKYKKKVVSPDFSIDEAENRRTVLRKKIEGLNDVNLGAIKDFEEARARYDFLVSQKEDLNAAINDLKNVIKKINRITQSKFMETFDAINTRFKEIFSRLFNGGSAWLELTEPDKPLETGVELMIHPPGKRVSRLSLLSGGEKALSAIAFIFSIFLLNPASFCIVDEIDAPLDEVNVQRFNELVKIIGEQTQVIMITHNRNSMMFADMLFGITMSGSGVSKIISVDINEAVKLAGQAGSRTKYKAGYHVSYTN